MNIRKFKKFIAEYGFEFERMGKGDHEIWKNAKGDTFPVPSGHDVK